ncbi:MAG: hypothetical protein EBX37_06920, partial [Alphaproteobacteria bacterium]|nr:hypothetical protein [Alphaproteobacteria bacterium]
RICKCDDFVDIFSHPRLSSMDITIFVRLVFSVDKIFIAFGYFYPFNIKFYIYMAVIFSQ